MEVKNRRNNIVLFGIQREIVNDTPTLCQKLKELLKINISEKDINNTYCLGNKDNSPIKIELISQLKKRQILDNTKHLKGSKIYIAHDLTKKHQQEELKVLKAHLRIIREEEPEVNSYIRGNKIFINYKGYSITELENGAYHIKTRRRTNSTPASPISSRNPEDDVFISTELETLEKIERQEPKTSKQTKSEEPTSKQTETKRTPSTVATGEISRNIQSKSASSPYGYKMTTRKNRKIY